MPNVFVGAAHCTNRAHAVRQVHERATENANSWASARGTYSAGCYIDLQSKDDALFDKVW